MPCRKIKKGGERCTRRKKVKIMKKAGKKHRYYFSGKKWIRLKGNKKAPRVKR